MSIQPPRPRNPPLNALRAFEAAARLGGFARAAEELSVSPGAVAQQVRQLEDWADAPLFERRAQGVVLTEAGARVLPAAREAFDRIGEVSQALRAEARGGQLAIAALPAIAQLWLAPRLPRARAACPDVRISLTALEHAPNLQRAPFDATFFLAETGGEVLAQDRLIPVCAPDLARQITALDDLLQVPCLRDSAWADDWAVWLAAAGRPDLRVAGPEHSLYALAVEDAIAGGGVLIGHAPLVRPALDDGRLVRLFDPEVPTPHALRMQRPATHRRDRRVQEALEVLCRA